MVSVRVSVRVSCSGMNIKTPTNHAMHFITPSRHCAVYKAGFWVWSTGDGRQSTVDNKWRWSTCRHKIILSSEVGEKEITLIFRDIWISYLFDKYSPAAGGTVP